MAREWCESNAQSVSDRRVLLTKWVATAVDTVGNRAGYRFRLPDKTRSLMTADGTGDERINLEGLTEPFGVHGRCKRGRGGWRWGGGRREGGVWEKWGGNQRAES